MSLFGKAPSTAPTFGCSDQSSAGSMDGFHIQADKAGAVIPMTAAPLVDRSKGDQPAASGIQAASPSPSEALRASLVNWEAGKAVANAVALAAGVGAMAAGAGSKNDPLGLSAGLQAGEAGVNDQIHGNFEGVVGEHSGENDKETTITTKN